MCRPPKDAIASSSRRGKQSPDLVQLIGTVEKVTADVIRIAQESTSRPSTPPTSSADRNETRGNDVGSGNDIASPVASAATPTPKSTIAEKRTRKESADEGNDVEPLGTAGGASPKRRRRSKSGAGDTLGGHGHKSHPHNVVHHDYHDYATPGTSASFAAFNPVLVADVPARRGRGGISSPFPTVLHQMLEHADREGYSDIVSWSPHGRAFHVHQQERFTDEVMPRFFRQTR